MCDVSVFCRTCARLLTGSETICPDCGRSPTSGMRFCQGCGAETRPRQNRCIKCGVLLSGPQGAKGQRSWLITLLLCIFTGFFGGHRFYTGHIVSGVVQAMTYGGFLVWWLYDLGQIIADEFQDAEGRFLER